MSAIQAEVPVVEVQGQVVTDVPVATAIPMTQPRAGYVQSGDGSLMVGPPNPVHAAGYGGTKKRSSYGTGSPDTIHVFNAPLLDGAMSEANFNRAITMVHADGTDSLSSVYNSKGGEPLNVDVEGRVDTLKAVASMNRHCAICCLFTPGCPCALGMLLCPGGCSSAPFGTGETNETQQLRAQAKAHELTLNDDCIAYRRAAHLAKVIENYVTYDQYGHK